MKKFLYIALAVAATGLASCSDDDPKRPVNDNPLAPIEGYGAYVLNQGNYYNGIEGGLSVIDYDSPTAMKNVFVAANKRSLGDTPQCGVAYGSKIYIGTSVSNTIEVIDRATCKAVKQIKLAESSMPGRSPYCMISHKGKVFISMYDGYLARLDTLTLEIDKSIPVGPNPDQIALYRGKIYVPVSDGMNWPNYGTTACVVDPQSMTVERTFTVGLNPTQFVEADDRLFVLCKGNYSTDPTTLVPSKLYEVKSDFSVRAVCDASIVCEIDDRIAVINQPWTEGDPIIEYKLYDPESGKTTEWNIQHVDYANAIFYDDEADRVLIASYVMNGKYPSYDLPGYVNVYDDRFRFQTKYEIGAAGPACIFTHPK